MENKEHSEVKKNNTKANVTKLSDVIQQPDDNQYRQNIQKISEIASLKLEEQYGLPLNIASSNASLDLIGANEPKNEFEDQIKHKIELENYLKEDNCNLSCQKKLKIESDQNDNKQSIDFDTENNCKITVLNVKKECDENDCKKTFESEVSQTDMNTVDYENENSPEFIWKYQISSNKNFIATLNEYCLSAKVVANFVQEKDKNHNKSSKTKVVFTTVSLSNNNTEKQTVSREPGISKQLSKQNVCKKALHELIYNDPEVRIKILDIVKKFTGVLQKPNKKLLKKKKLNKGIQLNSENDTTTKSIEKSSSNIVQLDLNSKTSNQSPLLSSSVFEDPNIRFCIKNDDGTTLCKDTTNTISQPIKDTLKNPEFVESMSNLETYTENKNLENLIDSTNANKDQLAKDQLESCQKIVPDSLKSFQEGINIQNYSSKTENNYNQNLPEINSELSGIILQKPVETQKGELCKLTETKNEEKIKGFMQFFHPEEFTKEAPSTNLAQTSSIVKKETNQISIKEMIKGNFDNKVLDSLDQFAIDRKISIKWKFEHKGSKIFSKILLGDLYAYGSHKKKRKSKLNAAKHLLSIIESNLDMKVDFESFLESEKDTSSNKNDTSMNSRSSSLNIFQSSSYNEKPKLNQKNNQFLTTNEAKKCLLALNDSIKPNFIQKEGMKVIFNEVNKIFMNCCNNLTLKLQPIGSYLNQSTRAKRLDIDCIPFASSNVSYNVDFYTIAKDLLNCSLENLPQNFPIELALHYKITFSKVPENKCSILEFQHRSCEIKLKVFQFDKSEFRVKTTNKNEINIQNCMIFHSQWLEDNMRGQYANEDLIMIFRLVRHWREIKNINFPTEILDLAVFYSTFNFKDFDLVKVLLKFFTLVVLLINKYFDNFYEISEYHSYLVSINDQEIRNNIIKKAHKTFLNLTNNNLSDFFDN